jgi:hypothetical protein
MSDNAALEQVVMKRYGTGVEHGELCEVVAIINEPAYELRTVEGQEFSWCQSLTRPATDGETIDFWRSRARRAERELESARRALADADNSKE